jgi:hypothetical protein
MIFTIILFLASLAGVIYGAKNFKHLLIDVSIIFSCISVILFLLCLWM